MKKNRVVHCGRCRLPIEPDELIVEFEDRGSIHLRCWQINDLEDTRTFAHFVRRSQRLIDKSRARLDSLCSWLRRAS